MLAPAKLVFWWRYRVSQAVCQWLVVGVSFEKGLWDAPHFGRLCRPLNGFAMARRRGGAAVGFGPVPGGVCYLVCACVCVSMCTTASSACICALHVGAVFSIPGILLTARAVQLLSEFCKPSEQTSCRQLSTLVSLDKVEGWG